MLLFIAMPAKYKFGHDFVFPVGMTHGVLWMVYVVASLVVSHLQRWSVLTWALSLLCSVLPFGFVLLDYKLRRDAAAASGAPVVDAA